MTVISMGEAQSFSLWKRHKNGLSESFCVFFLDHTKAEIQLVCVASPNSEQ